MAVRGTCVVKCALTVRMQSLSVGYFPASFALNAKQGMSIVRKSSVCGLGIVRGAPSCSSVSCVMGPPLQTN